MAKPATQRPKLPGVGRLGLVEPKAQADLDGLGWNTDVHVELLWSLSRAPDADTALKAIVRLSEALGPDWADLDAALLKDRSLRGRLFGVLGSSLALGDHLVANPQSWRLLAGAVSLPVPHELREMFAEEAAKTDNPTTAVPPLRTLYRDRLLVLAALDVASVVENEPVLPFTVVGEHLSDLADAALAAALQVATASVCGDKPVPALTVVAMGKCGARELNYVSDVDVIFVADDDSHSSLTTATRIAGEMMRLASGVLRSGRRAAPGG